jgi:hypothetical protein
VGLVKYGAERVQIARMMPQPLKSSRPMARGERPMGPRLGSRIGDWFREVF